MKKQNKKSLYAKALYFVSWLKYIAPFKLYALIKQKKLAYAIVPLDGGYVACCELMDAIVIKNIDFPKLYNIKALEKQGYTHMSISHDKQYMCFYKTQRVTLLK